MAIQEETRMASSSEGQTCVVPHMRALMTDSATRVRPHSIIPLEGRPYSTTSKDVQKMVTDRYRSYTLTMHLSTQNR
jgi:hypothetical protein